MNSFDRVLFVLFNLAVVIISAYVLGAAIGLLGPIANLALLVLASHQLEVSLASLVLFFLALRFLYFGTVSPQSQQQAGFVHESELGQIKISLEALKQVAEQVVSAHRGVRQARIRLHLQSGGVAIRVRLSTNGQQNLVELARSLQQTIKEQVEKVTNVAVSDVIVLFSEVGNERPRPI